jgi:hypothetical protein
VKHRHLLRPNAANLPHQLTQLRGGILQQAKAETAANHANALRAKCGQIINFGPAA